MAYYWKIKTKELNKRKNSQITIFKDGTGKINLGFKIQNKLGYISWDFIKACLKCKILQRKSETLSVSKIHFFNSNLRKLTIKTSNRKRKINSQFSLIKYFIF